MDFAKHLCVFLVVPKCWKTFCENSPEINYLRQHINSIDEYDLYSNQYVGNFICEWYSITHQDNIIPKRAIAYYLLTYKNRYFNSVLNRYINNKQELTEYLNCCSLGVLNLFNIQCSTHLLEICWPNLYERNLTDKQLYDTQHCMDCYQLESCMYCNDLKYIENVLTYVVLGNSGLIHQFDGNLDEFWSTISNNVIALQLIEKFLPKMDERNLNAFLNIYHQSLMR